MLGFAGVSNHDDACHSQGVLAQILGGGIASRLFMEIREKRALVYSVYASPNAFGDGGSMSFYAGTGREEIAELVPVLCDELNKVRGTVTAVEVERAERSANQILDYGRVIPVAETISEDRRGDGGQRHGRRRADPPQPSGDDRRWQAG